MPLSGCELVRRVLTSTTEFMQLFSTKDTKQVIDQQSLKYITEQKVSEGIQHKLMLKLLEFNYKIEYKKKKTRLQML